MSRAWQQATATWTLYSEALAGLADHLSEAQWQALMAALRTCRGKSPSRASAPPASQREKSPICWPALNVRRSTLTPPTPRMATWVFGRGRSGHYDLSRRELR